MLKERAQKIYFHRHSLWDLIIKQLRSKYAGSKLGIWWAVITPLLLAISINFVFNKVFKINIPGYTIFVLSGMIPWFFSITALQEAADSFIVNSSILKQCIFPREFIVISSVTATLLAFLIGLSFLSPLFIISNFKLTQLLPTFFLITTLHFIFILGLGFLFSSINIFFRDLSHFLSIAFMVWFWITPVFYSMDMLSFPYRWICLFNPITYFIISYQHILFEAKAPSLITIFAAFLIAFAFFIAGYIFFLKKESELLKRI